MKKLNILFRLVFTVLCTLNLYAQNDSVFLEGVSLKSNAIDKGQTQSVLILSDSILKKSQPSLTSLLNYNTPIYFKENGLGMVSSPSFRGTTATQTVVLWNGININSQTTGQTDFNTVNIRGFDNVAVLAGGGNVAEINSAIGGSIHLNNELRFNRETTNELFVRYGSFNTLSADYNIKHSTDKVAFSASLARNSSDNDYEFIGTQNRRNINGQFYNHNLSTSAAYKINSRNILKFFGNIYQSERHFAVITPYATKSKYDDFNTRGLVDWTALFGKFNSSVKLAYITEKYRYYNDIDYDYNDPGEVESIIAKYDLKYDLNDKISLKLIFDYMRNDGFSGNDMQSQSRNIGSGSLSFRHIVSDKFFYEASLRQEVNDLYENPLLYSLGGRWDVAKNYRIKFNASKNFRIPTYNDLYWPGVGNPDLLPEKSFQAEIGNELHAKGFSFLVTAYYNKVENLLRWIPNANPLGGLVWMPENVEDVNIYGIESLLRWQKRWNNHQINLSGTYAYTVSEEQKIDKQLIYVPYHKTTASVSYGWKKFSLFYQFLFVGEVFTTTQNEASNILDKYFVNNIGLDYDFGKNKTYKIGFEILNLMDYEYQSVQNRPMPGRNYHVFINIKI